MTGFLRVKNLSRFQHYKKRNPPWIKLYRTVITGEDGQLDDFLTLTESEQWQLVRIWVLASQCDHGLLRDDERWLRRAIRSERRVPVEKFVQDGWLEQIASTSASTDASAVLANRPDFKADVGPPEKTEKTESSEISSSNGAVTPNGTVDEQHLIHTLIGVSLRGAAA